MKARRSFIHDSLAIFQLIVVCVYVYKGRGKWKGPDSGSIMKMPV